MDYKEPSTFFSRVAFLVLPVTFGAKINIVTPKVSNAEVFTCAYTSPTTITNFVGGSDNQTIRVLGDGNATVKNGTNIFTNTGANKLLVVNKVYRFTYINNLWYEDAN